MLNPGSGLEGRGCEPCKPTLAGPAHVVSAGLDACGSKTAAITELRIVAAAADLLPVEARGTFLRCVVAELRGRGDFSDCDVEQVVRATLLE